MPDFLEKLSELHLDAVRTIADEILSKLAAKELTPEEIERRYSRKGAVKGWEFDLLTPTGRLELDLLVKATFPFEQPIVSLRTPPRPLTFPHVEDDGVLCLPSVENCLVRPSATTRELISDAVRLMADGVAKRNTGDFQNEFDSYWVRSWDGERQNFLSLLEPIEESRIVSVLRSDNVIVLGEDDVALGTWFKNYKGMDFPLEKGGVLWLPEPLLPDEYPNVNSDILRLSKAHQKAISVLDELGEGFPESVPLVFASKGFDGLTLGGIVAHRTRRPESKYIPKAAVFNRGFRPGQLPASVSRDRYWRSETAISRGTVTRADRQWVHSRDDSEIVASVSDSRVLLIGCGSLGGFLAKMLATSGVGKVVTIDDELLTWPNVGRHYLGGRNVDKHKAEALAKELQQDYPHLSFEHRNQRWQQVLGDEPALFSSATLVISATGDFPSDTALNLWQRSSAGSPPIVYGWLEAFACASHALAVLPSGRCFNCAFDADGMFRFNATEWKASTLKKEPACGVTFQPYGSIELSQAVTLTARLAIDLMIGKTTVATHRIVTSSSDLLESMGGQWTDYWDEASGGNTSGGFVLNTDWQPGAGCDVCGGAVSRC